MGKIRQKSEGLTFRPAQDANCLPAASKFGQQIQENKPSEGLRGKSFIGNDLTKRVGKEELSEPTWGSGEIHKISTGWVKQMRQRLDEKKKIPL